jgi:vacuolar protein sorting-associated protein 52
MILGDRYKVADDSKFGVIFPKALTKTPTKLYTYDIIFKSLNVYLTQIGNTEYLFLQDFFEDVSMFTEIFAKINGVMLRTWNVFCDGTFDILGILIMIRVLRQLEVALNKRGVLGLNDYFEEVQLLLFSKFKSLLDLNAQSIKEANLTKLVKMEFDSNNLSKRYSILSTSVCQLNKDETLKRHIEGHMELLRKPFDELLKTIAEMNPEKSKKLVYLINSYDIIRTNLIRSKLECSDLSHFTLQLQEAVKLFVKDELGNYFGYLINFVDETELIVDEKASIIQNFSKIDSNSLEELIKMFEKNWKPSLGTMHGNMIKYFRNFDMGMDILQRSWSILVDYYDKLHKIVKLCYQNPPFRSSLVSPQFIIYEMRKYVKDFN